MTHNFRFDRDDLDTEIFVKDIYKKKTLQT